MMAGADRNGFKLEPPASDLLRRRINPPSPGNGQFSFDEFLQWAAANNKPARPIGYFESRKPKP